MVWLLPSSEDAEGLGACIRDLAARTGGPAFAPHLTLGRATRAAPGNDLDLPPIRLEVTGVEDGPSTWMCVYLAFPRDARLDALRRGLEVHDARGAIPHVSLAYGPLDAEVREALKAAWTPPSHVTFDRVQWVPRAMPPGPDPDARAHVATWTAGPVRALGG